MALLALVFARSQAQKNVYGFTVENEKGEAVTLKQFKGQVMLIVNTATRCGFTKQYAALEALYEKYKNRGLVVLDFPCNQFGQQAPGTMEEIQQFCLLEYDTKFPLFNKIEVNGPNAIPLYTYLKKKQGFTTFGTDQTAQFMDQMLKKQDPDYASKSDIKWNFTKFLVNRKGKVVARFEPTASMDEVERAILKLLE